jgi:uncharacterized protein
MTMNRIAVLLPVRGSGPVPDRPVQKAPIRPSTFTTNEADRNRQGASVFFEAGEEADRAGGFDVTNDWPRPRFGYSAGSGPPGAMAVRAWPARGFPRPRRSAIVAYMEPSLTDALCTRCGLCCDGSLFADVEITEREGVRLELLGLDVEDGEGPGTLLAQPCGALRGTRCSIYVHRPRCCRTFECRLLGDARRGVVSVARAGEVIVEAHARIARVKTLLRDSGGRRNRLPLGERCADVLAGAAGDATRQRKRAELEAAWSALQGWLRSRFLGAAGTETKGGSRR